MDQTQFTGSDAFARLFSREEVEDIEKTILHFFCMKIFHAGVDQDSLSAEDRDTLQAGLDRLGKNGNSMPIGLSPEAMNGDHSDVASEMMTKAVTAVNMAEAIHGRIAVIALASLTSLHEVTMRNFKEETPASVKQGFEERSKDMMRALYEGTLSDFAQNFEKNVRGNIDCGGMVDFLGDNTNAQTRAEILGMLDADD